MLEARDQPRSSSPGDQGLWLPRPVSGWVLGASRALGASSQLVLTEAFAKGTPSRWGRAGEPRRGRRAGASIAASIAAVLSRAAAEAAGRGRQHPGSGHRQRVTVTQLCPSHWDPIPSTPNGSASPPQCLGLILRRGKIRSPSPLAPAGGRGLSLH